MEEVLDFKEYETQIQDYNRSLTQKYSQILAIAKAIKSQNRATEEQAREIENILNTTVPTTCSQKIFAYNVWYLYNSVFPNLNSKKDFRTLLARNYQLGLVLLLDGGSINVSLDLRRYVNITIESESESVFKVTVKNKADKRGRFDQKNSVPVNKL